MYEKDELIAALRRMGIGPQDTLLVHSSMKSIGPVNGRADTVLDALSEYLQPGLLVFPTLSYGQINSEHPRFSVTETPSECGILSELFRQRPGVIRSWHPTHSLAALGPDAAALVAGHECFETPCARRSPWGRLVDRHAKLLFIGTGISCNTLLHGVEEWARVPNSMTHRPQRLEILTPDGRVIPCPSLRHMGARSQFYDKMEDLYEYAGMLRRGTFGDAVCHLLDVRPMAALTLRLLREDRHLFDDDRLPVPQWLTEPGGID